MKYKKLLLLTLVLTTLFIVGHVALAQLGVEYGAYTGLGQQNLRLTIAQIIRVVLGLVGIVILALMIYAGFLWMTSAGDSDKIDRAKHILINATIGLAITLSAFAITQFIISQLTSATGFNEAGGPGGGGGGGLGGGAYVLRGLSPAGSVPIRNVVVRAIFSGALDASSVAGNFEVRKVADNTVMAGTSNVLGSELDFTPSADCPSPNQTLKCFDENTEYIIEAKTGLKSASGQSLVCGGFAPVCTVKFTTGSLIDVTAPTVSLTYPNAAFPYIYASSPNELQAVATDDSGISYVKFLKGDILIDTLVPPTSVKNYNAILNWDGAGLQTGSKVTLNAAAGDLDSHETMGQGLEVTVLAAHCNNALKDADETGVDCGGSDCLICSGSSCQNNTQCASGSCVGGQCVDQPLILNVAPLDGAVGNLVTISGKYFGSTAGSVVFLGGAGSADDKVASLAGCGTPWTNTQIIVAVPPGVVSGPIRVTAANTLVDETKDGRGPNLGDFIVNTTVRPGICGLTPASGSSGDQVTILGTQFGAGQGSSEARFETRLAGIVSGKWNNTNITAIVPNLTEGSYRVTVVRNNEVSNPVLFQVLLLSATLPEISYIDPLNGPVGQYVTIFGQRFGATPGTIIFKNPTTGDEALGDVDFPPQCGSNFWHNDYIIVKVPSQYKTGLAISKNIPLNVSVVRSDGAKSTPVAFTVNNNPLKPGICKLAPDNGPVGTLVNVFGENFSDLPGKVNFFDNQEGLVSYWNPNGEEAAAQVPAGAKTGPVVLENKNNILSNGANFAVADCRQAGCGTGEKCCGASCILASEVCVSVKQSGFMWRVATGPLRAIPHVVEQQSCTLGTQTPSPWKNSVDACINASISFRFNTLMDHSSLNVTSVKVEPCGTGINGNFSDGLCGGSLSGFSNFNFIDTKTDTGVTIDGGTLDSNLFYRVTVLQSVKSVEGVSMSAPYAWHFKTVSSTVPCALSQVQVSPPAITLTNKYVNGLEKNSQGEYAAAPEAANCNILKCNAYQWNWSLSGPPNIASLSNNTCDAMVNALAETGATPLDVNVEAKTLTGLDPHSDTAQLTIKFADPAVTDYWPNCGAACVNAQLGATFNTAMDPSTINAGTVKVLECTEESCSAFSGEVVMSDMPYDPATSILRLYPSGLKPNTYYRVRLSSGILSSNGAKLTGLNESGQYFSWVFKTKNDATLCGIARVEASPANATARIIGESTVFISVPYGSADSCNSTGQALNPTAYAWGWNSSQTGVGNFEHWATLNWSPYNSQAGELFNFSPRLNGQACNASCLFTGAALLGTCGNGQIDKGENCDDGNQTSGDGCSSQCLLEGSSNDATLMAQYTMDDSDISGTAIFDHSSHGNNGGLNGTASAIGKINQAREFNGATDYVSVADSNSLDLTVDLSISLWVKLNALTTGATLVDKGGNSYIFAMYPNGHLTISKNGRDELQSLGTLTTNTWYHVAATHQNGVSAIYINGVLDNSASNKQDFLNTTSPLRIGIDNNGIFKTNGFIDDVRIYNYALSGAEINQIYTQTAAEAVGSTCGNKKIETGEACDDGNTANNDGCSNQCLNEGSAKGGSVCGNGDKGKGEDCDDGNTRNGDGCSAICLAEGATSAATAGCGNGLVEPAVGEQCDDGANNGKLGDGCSTKCLLVGSTGSAICGNKKIETGEACDDGNTVNGDGCSSKCLNEGSSIYYYDVYNPKLPAGFGSVCGNGVVERGEDCDAGLDTVKDKGIDPLQVVRAVSGLGTKNQSTIETSSSGVSGTANYQVQCGARNDFDCNGGINAGAGTGSCCYPRPTITGNEPQGAGVCRNAAMIAHFNQIMAPVTFETNVYLLKEKGATTTCANPQTINNIVYCSGPSATFEAQNIDDSPILADGTIGDGIVDHTDLIVRQSDALEPNTKYAIRIIGDGDVGDKGKGVLSQNQVGLDTPQYVWTFQTGTDICKIQAVEVDPSNRYFKNVAEQQQFTSHAMSRSGQAGDLIKIVSIPSYSWTNAWAVSDSSLLQIAGASNGSSVAIKPLNKNGNSVVSALLLVTDKTGPQTVKTEASGQAQVKNFMCLNPVFMTDGTLGFTGNYNFSLVYCRDNNTPESTQDDLPALGMSSDKSLALFTKSGAELAYNKIKLADTVRIALDVQIAAFDPNTILKEKIILPNCSGLEEQYSAACKNNDAFGLRIIKNPNHLNPLDWYKANGFEGQPTALNVDGYEAIADGRTVYVVAGDLTKNSQGTTRLFDDVFVLSYSQNATPEVVRIFNQLLANWHFNTNLTETLLCNGTSVACSSDLDCKVSADTCTNNKCQKTGLSCVTAGDCALATTCDADLAKLRRNVRRITDLSHASQAVTAYQSTAAAVPTLKEGSFVRGATVSTWPSWKAALSNTLSNVLPVDPLNKFSACGLLDGQSGTDPATCWNDAQKSFSCSPDSQFYLYQSYDSGSFMLYGKLESLNSNIDKLPSIPNVSFTLDAQLCDARVVSSQAKKCGNGVVEFGEQCDGNNPTQCNNGSRQVCDTSCQWVTDNTCARTSCGNGVVEPKNGEVCDEGSLNGSYGHCNTSCTGVGLFCGDSVRQPEEYCDAGAANGDYYTGTKVCSNDATKDCTTDSNCSGGARCVPQTLSCNSLCDGYGPYCGDRLVNGAEVCDSNTMVGDRLCENTNDSSASSYKTCASVADCLTGEKCLDSASAPPPVGTGNVKARWVASCNPTSCRFDKASTAEIGQCGNGLAEPGEECDDGNTNNNDNCSKTCKLARCGDGLLETGLEQCDQGASNGVAPTNVPYGKIANYCGATCKIITISGGTCGDGQVSGPEQCDGSVPGSTISCTPGYTFGGITFPPVCIPVPGLDPFNGKSCTDYIDPNNGLTYASGDLTCTSKCQVDTAQCQPYLFSRAGVQGSLDWTDNQSCSIGGWALEPPNTNPISVVVYKDDSSVLANKLGTYTADQPDAAVLQDRFGSSFTDVNHGYNISLPTGVKDNTAHNIFVYGIGSDGTATELDNVPKSITCPLPPPPPSIDTFYANPTSVSSGQSSKLTWSASNAPGGCTGSSNPPSAWTGQSVGVSGTDQTTGALNTVGTYTFTLTCTGAGGVQVSRQASVTVSALAPVILAFDATPSSITLGSTTKLTWRTQNATACTSPDFNTGNAANNTTGVTVTPSSLPKTYNLTCTGPGSPPATKSVTVTATVILTIPTLTFTASLNPVVSGNSTTLIWSSSNVTTCTASNAWGGPKNTFGSTGFGPITSPLTFTLSCNGPSGSVTKSVTVTVTAAPDTTPPTVTITAPKDGDTVQGNNTGVAADAFDNVGIARVEFWLDGNVPLGTDTTGPTPYSITWDTTKTTNGTHYLRAVAYDTSNNAGTSAVVSVIVANFVNDAAFVPLQTVPNPMFVGEKPMVSITMRNTGSTTWSTAGLYRLGSQNPQDNTIWGINRVNLDNSVAYTPNKINPEEAFMIALTGVFVAPGNVMQFNFPITTPSTPGTYNFQWRMVQDGKEWFGELTPNVAVNVLANCGNATPISQDCCANPVTGPYCTEAGTFCNVNNKCSTQCGDVGQICCTGTNGNACKSLATCSGGLCPSCGGLNQACCNGTTCTAPGTVCGLGVCTSTVKGGTGP